MKDEWSKRRAHIPSTSALPAHAAPVAIASALQGSTLQRMLCVSSYWCWKQSFITMLNSAGK